MRFLLRMAVALCLAQAAWPAADIDSVIVRPKESNEVLVNPGIGFTTFQRFNGDSLNQGVRWTEGFPIEYKPFTGNHTVKGQPLTTVAYFRVYWRFLEPEKGKYRWELIDTALRTAHDRGQTLMLRVAPYGTDKKTDVPDWYRAEAGDETGKLPLGKWLTDAEHPHYLKYFGGFVREFGKRYDG
ncbi:MAG: beta-galactosidase, partial [Acidobacteria bacterium]|nr:beta-galactosidase [Acidobacteriota bacterium]